MQTTLCTEDQGIELLYRGKSLYNIPFDDVEKFNSMCEQLDIEQLVNKVDYSKEFNIPQHYKQIDVEQYVRNLARNVTLDGQKRVEMELELFRTRKLFPILQLLIYIVDTLRKHNLVWGVGRGSSVASYCLYLIGVHKIDSVKYKLDIREFLK
jgi:DNA polymerase III alpha subunit